MEGVAGASGDLWLVRICGAPSRRLSERRGKALCYRQQIGECRRMNHDHGRLKMVC